MEVTTVSDVRRTCGITKALIDDDDVQRTIERAVNETDKLLNSSVKPRETIYVFSPDDTGDTTTALLDHYPILQIKSMKLNGTSVSPRYVRVYSDEGRLELMSDAEVTTFDIDKAQNNVVKYVYGLMEPDDYEVETTSAVTTPTDDYTLPVTAGTGTSFKVNDWVRVEGIDGYFEVTKVEGTAADTLTVDLVCPHESGSRVILMAVPGEVKRLVEVVASLMLVAREVGESFDDIVGYTLGDRQVQKGEPYTQWRETHVHLMKEYERLTRALRMLEVA